MKISKALSYLVFAMAAVGANDYAIPATDEITDLRRSGSYSGASSRTTTTRSYSSSGSRGYGGSTYVAVGGYGGGYHAYGYNSYGNYYNNGQGSVAGSIIGCLCCCCICALICYLISQGNTGGEVHHDDDYVEMETVTTVTEVVNGPQAH